MSIYPLYQNFLHFLDEIKIKSPTSFFEIYEKVCLNPYLDFWSAYFENFGITHQMIRERVNRIKIGEYDQLKEALSNFPLLQKSNYLIEFFNQTFQVNINPSIYLAVGFFSPEAYLIKVKENFAVGIGLERFKNFYFFPVFFIHELSHYYQREERSNTLSQKESLGYNILTEGLSVFATLYTLPEYPLYTHLFLSREELNWCTENTDNILNQYLSLWDWEIEKLFIFPPLNLTWDSLFFRTRYYLGYKLIEEYQRCSFPKSFPQLAKDEFLKIDKFVREKFLNLRN